MKNAWETYGAAYLGGQLLVARVENDGTRTMVTALLTAEDNLNGDSLEKGRIFFNAGDRIAVVKKIHIKNVSPEDAIGRVRFEMASSLLDQPENFYIDALPIDENGKYRRFLSIAYHREEIDQQIEKYTDLLRKPSGFKLDAVALADGYLNFCQVEPGDLQVLVNIESESVVLAIIYRQKLRAVGRLEITPGDEITSKTATGLASELKMTVSYHLAEL
ncbi:MAG: hypothetical protein GY841_03265, partial [FCB group bacterium]|nr:hypothetical protein [FCB group bacterium]